MPKSAYLSKPDVAEKGIFQLAFRVKKNGFLFLGPTETAVALNKGFTELSSKWNILKSNKSGRSLQLDSFLSPVIDLPKTTAMAVNGKTRLPLANLRLADNFSVATIEQSGYSVCTNENLQVTRSSGDPSPYLKNEIFNFDLTSLLPDNITVAFKAAAHKALKSNQKVVLKGLRFKGADMEKTHLADIEVKPFFANGPGSRSLLFLFKENKSWAKEINIGTNAEIRSLTKEHVSSLEAEVAELKHELEVANERISSSNENMQSFNEELLSANEEMQSANEELQSINEELYSVNEELQNVNKEHQLTINDLTELNDDLDNYFRSNANSQLFVDRDLLLKKYSPGVIKHVNLRENDIGRPLANITTNIKTETLIADIKQVMLDGITIMREAEALDGKIYQITTMPYVRKNSRKADGAIVSFYDISELKKLLKELDISNKSLLRINDDLNNFVYGASHDLNGPINNIEMVLGILNKKMNMKNPAVKNLYEMVERAIFNFKAVITDLGKVGKIDAEMQEESKSENFESIFKEIEELISEKIKLTHTVFTTNFLVKEVQFPKKYLRSTILNLITNAIKFSAPNKPPQIEIKTENVEGFVLLTVKDNGIGISADRLEYIFKMYHRISNDVEGQGIGLYLIKKIIDAAGGKIEAESEEGKGSILRVYFKV